MTAAADSPRHALPRYPLPWISTRPTPMISPDLLHRPRVVPMSLFVSTGVSIAPRSTMDIARQNAAALTTNELDQIMRSVRAAADATVAGRGTRLQWACLCTALHVSRAVEDGGVVRGLSAHLDDIERTLNALGTRAGDTQTPPTWRAPALRHAEMDDVRLLASLHAQQLARLSYGEYHTAWRLAVARVRSAGGEAINVEFVEVAQ